MSFYLYCIAPFIEDQALQKALVACAALAIGGAPLGVFLVLRRMTLMGDALSHAILPGIALVFFAFGLSFWPMMLGGLATGLLVALAARFITRFTPLKEDASLGSLYIVSLALGVAILSLRGESDELIHVLFGDASKIQNESLIAISLAASISVLALTIGYRALIAQSFDGGYLQLANPRNSYINEVFFALVVLMLVSAFQALGTLMALGLMLLPAISTRLWTNNIDKNIGLSIIFALLAAFIGLLVSHYYPLPSGVSVILVAGGFYLFSILFGCNQGLIMQMLAFRHFEPNTIDKQPCNR